MKFFLDDFFSILLFVNIIHIFWYMILFLNMMHFYISNRYYNTFEIQMYARKYLLKIQSLRKYTLINIHYTLIYTNYTLGKLILLLYYKYSKNWMFTSIIFLKFYVHSNFIRYWVHLIEYMIVWILVTAFMSYITQRKSIILRANYKDFKVSVTIKWIISSKLDDITYISKTCINISSITKNKKENLASHIDYETHSNTFRKH